MSFHSPHGVRPGVSPGVIGAAGFDNGAASPTVCSLDADSLSFFAADTDVSLAAPRGVPLGDGTGMGVPFNRQKSDGGGGCVTISHSPPTTPKNPARRGPKVLTSTNSVPCFGRRLPNPPLTPNPSPSSSPAESPRRRPSKNDQLSQAPDGVVAPGASINAGAPQDDVIPAGEKKTEKMSTKTTTTIATDKSKNSGLNIPDATATTKKASSSSSSFHPATARPNLPSPLALRLELVADPDAASAPSPDRSDALNSTSPASPASASSACAKKKPTFHLNELADLGRSGVGRAVAGGDDAFAGTRDLIACCAEEAFEDRCIKSSKGTVRGVKNRVKVGVVTFHEHTWTNKPFILRERGMVVLYVTSMRIIRETYDRCQRARNILQTHLVAYDERDTFHNRRVQLQLKDRLGFEDGLPALPQIFIDGEHFGSCEQIEQLNETGQLRKILRHFKKIDPRADNCQACAGLKYVPCPRCCGTTKNYIRHVKTADYVKLKCVTCDASGLVRCDQCVNSAKLDVDGDCGNSSVLDSLEEGIRI